MREKVTVNTLLREVIGFRRGNTQIAYIQTRIHEVDLADLTANIDALVTEAPMWKEISTREHGGVPSSVNRLYALLIEELERRQNSQTG